MDRRSSKRSNESPRRRSATERLGGLVRRAVPAVAAFAVAFCVAFAVQGALAAEDGIDVSVVDVSVMDENRTVYGYASSAESAPPTSIELSAKGERLQVYGVAWWADGSSSINPSGMSYEIIGGDGIVTITADGTLTALGDGEATLRVTMSERTASGEPISLDVPVVVIGQTARYVTGITLTDSTGSAVDSLPLEEDLSTARVQLYALVTVFDPETGGSTQYDTRNGRLSQQASDLADLVWYVVDAQMGAVSEDGMYRPSVYGTNTVYAYSTAGLSGNVVSSGITVTTTNPAGGSENHAQETLSVTIYYENDPEYSVTKTYSVSDLERVGTFSATYTLVQDSGNAVEATGYGVSLRALIMEAAELDEADGLAAVQTLEFRSGADAAIRTITCSVLFETRYYFPNYDLNGSTNGAVAVEPMLAFESNWQTVGSSVGSEITNNTQFRLLLGTTMSKESMTSFSIKWVNEMTITLAGGPPVESGEGSGDDGDPDGSDDPDDATDPDDPDDPDDPGGSGGSDGTTNPGSGGSSSDGGGSGGGDGEGAGSGDGGGSGDGDGGSPVEGSGGSSDDEEGGGGSAGIDGSSDSSDTLGESSEDALGGAGWIGRVEAGGSSGSGTSGRYSMYQVMNPYSSGIDIEYPDNPLGPYANACAVGAVAAGATEAALRYRRQTKPLDMKAYAAAAGDGRGEDEGA